MDFLNERECKLCGIIIKNEDCAEIHDIMKEIFAVILWKLTLDSGAQHVTCKVCYGRLLDALKFKGTCLDTDDAIVPYFDSENPRPVDLKEVYRRVKGSKAGNCIGNQEICRLCFQAKRSKHKPIHEVSANTIEMYIPEINFSATKDPVICIKCFEALSNHSAFIKSCLDVEQNRTVINHCIKAEQLDIKSEETEEDETIFIIPKIEEDQDGASLDIEETNSQWGSDNLEPTEGAVSTSASVELDFMSASASRCSTDESGHKSDFDVEVKKPYRELKCLVSSQDRHNRLYVCEYRCAFKQSQQCELKRLIRKDGSEVKIYKCDRCKYATKSKDRLEKHHTVHQVHPEVLMYQCDVCDYKSLYNGSLKRHQLKHMDASKVQKYQCDGCKFATECKYRLKTHQLRHRDPSEGHLYECDECDYRSLQKVHLKNHKLKHMDASQVQKYQCDRCKFATVCKYRLKTHKLRHMDPSEVRMYECNECSYKSLQKGNLKAHKSRHKNSFTTKYKSSLKSSIKQHVSKHKNSAGVKDNCRNAETIHGFKYKLET